MKLVHYADCLRAAYPTVSCGMLQEAQLSKMEAETAQIEASFKPIVRPEVQQTGGNPPPAAAEVEQQPETTPDVKPAEAMEESDLARLVVSVSEHFSLLKTP